MAKKTVAPAAEINETVETPKVYAQVLNENGDVEKLSRAQLYVKIVQENQAKRNETRSARYIAINEMMKAGKSMPVIAAELNLTYRQVKHIAWYIQHPEVPMPTR